ncbi:MAG: bifunctional oligoribonuclease/PAP phosphatase NrnA [Planctomycetes bacterium]|nr:bifunctional oligoribonuclease/PAP phosphatase NrnA [Planctomycetota bacterium]
MENLQTQPCKEVLAAFSKRRSVAITAHQRPDGDALGSSLALRDILRQAGHDAFVVGLEPIPYRYSFMAEKGEIVDPASGWMDKVDLFIILDCGAFDRVGEFAEKAKGKIRMINIDHHNSNTFFGDVNWVDSEASSTGEMIYRLAKEGGLQIPPSAATALWVAIITDTGKFSYENTKADTLRIGADLIDLGAKPAQTEHNLFQSLSLREVKLTERAISRLEMHAKGKVACVTLSNDDFEQLGCIPADAQDIVNIPRSLAGVEVGVFFYELPGGAETKVSLRTAPPYDASNFCKRFGGGGHQRAAGCSFNKKADETKEIVLREMLDYWFSGRA